MPLLGGAELQLSTHAALLAVSAIVGAVLLATTVRYRSERIALPIGLLFAVATVWAFADAARLAVGAADGMAIWVGVRAAVASPIGVLYLWIVLEYLDRDDALSPRVLAGLFSVSAVTVVLTAAGSDLVIASVEPVELTDPLLGTAYWTLHPSFGTWFFVNAAYNYLLILAAFGLLLRSLVSAGDVAAYRGQTATLLLAFAFPLAVNVAVHLGLLWMDLTAASFVVGLALLSAAIFRYELFTLLPIARDTAVENTDEGFFVLDRDDRIVDCNPAAAAMVGDDVASVVDRPMSEIYPRYAELVAEAEFGEEFSTELEVTTDGEPAYYDVTASSILDARDRYVGRVILVQDVTERVRRKKQLQERTTELAARTEELERQNERLEEFASVLSHDLRNPLGVAESYLQRARETGDPDDFDAVEESLDRIDHLVEDLLTMARQGQTVRDPGPVRLDDLAHAAWSHVDTAGAALEVQTEAVVEGDETRLMQVFENLFRNAVEHGSTSPPSQAREDAVEHGSTSSQNAARSDDAVEHGSPGADGAPTDDADSAPATALHDGRGGDAVVGRADPGDGTALRVRVGDLDDGFFVEDDGPGIPETDREQVFERGYTTETDGTGLGLSIVELAVEAHGWSVVATESTGGGARFEVRGVGRRSGDRP